jgi:NAD+ synthase
MTSEIFHLGVLDIDPESVVGAIAQSLTYSVSRVLKRRGVVVAVSGGIDSAVCAALSARAVGSQRVLALLMPESESDDGSTERGLELCEKLSLPHVVEDIGPILEAAGCYRRRDEAIREVFPEFGPGWRQKIGIAENLLDSDRVSYFNLVVQAPDGTMATKRMPADVYSRVVASTNMKQRTRKMLEYFHGDASNYGVIGTPNRLEYELGFFVRGGDGLADVKPIAHLYKTQVYRLAEHLGVPESIRAQTPSTDTYTLPQTQEEFYFALPYSEMDLMLWAWEHDVPVDDAAAVMNLDAEQVRRVYRDIVGKRRMSARGLADALLVEHVDVDERT